MLYHGTRYLKAIVRGGKLCRARVGRKVVCLTTKKSVAEYWAELDRDDDENIGYILYFRKGDLVATGHKLVTFNDPNAIIKEYEVVCFSDIDFRLCTRVDLLLSPVVYLPGY